MIGNIITGVVLCYGGLRVLDGDIKVGVLASFVLYLQRFFDPLQDVSQFYNTFQSAASALEKISGVLEEEPSVAEPGRCTAPARRCRMPPAPTPATGRRVQFLPCGSVTAPPSCCPGLTWTFPPGRPSRWSGETGAGKTTVARLLARFYDPNAGQVLLDGDRPAVAARRGPAARGGADHSGVVPLRGDGRGEHQAGTAVGVRRRGGGRRAGDRGARVHRRAARRVRDPVGKRGGKLSAGQRQLLSFCRAFIAAPSVLVLDEATALLDIPSERLVQSALRTVLAGRTALIIAHRLSTVAIADRVLVLRAGQVIEDGSPAELMGGTGEYADLHARWAASLA